MPSVYDDTLLANSISMVGSSIRFSKDITDQTSAGYLIVQTLSAVSSVASVFEQQRSSQPVETTVAGQSATNPSENFTVDSRARDRGSLIEAYISLSARMAALLRDQFEDFDAEAITTANAFLTHCFQNAWAPPKMASHGDDAIVFIWSLGGAKHAVTITPGEFSLVVERNGKIGWRVRSMEYNPEFAPIALDLAIGVGR